jgi:lysozyme
MDDLTRLHLIAQLERDEGRKNRAYQDSRGIWTVGVGHNLESTPLSDHAIDVIRDDDIAAKERELVSALPWLTTLDPVRFTVLMNMAFNLGVDGLLAFHDMISAIRAQNWERAADAMRDSKWAGQVGDRAIRLERQMVSGTW